ncbi:MAG TPA: CocE/NonD family hydrolase [Tepidisphaeraceae bacterium]|nr:CocE/NonD family hydrolase [Tepidisphaeraceae bacterium]
MQRPVMNPMFMEEKDAPAGSKKKLSARKRIMQFAWRGLLGGLKLGKRLLFTNVFRLDRRLRVEDGTPMQRFVRAMLYRLAFVPIILALFVTALVFAVTHPQRSIADTDPLVQGVYYDPVNFLSEDGTRLEGWLVPVYDARKVLEEKERALHKKHPAIVLVHDQTGTRQQMLPLVPQLHEAGMVVLVVGLRGTGPSGGTAQTFGLKEAMDVRAAVDMLRRRSYVDPSRVSVMGIGTGANAAVIAAAQDANIAALVLDRPIESFESAMASRLGDDSKWVRVLMPLFKWTFEAMYHVDADHLDVGQFADVTASRPTLRFAGSGTITPYRTHNAEGLMQFLQTHRITGDRAKKQSVASTRD